jgi:CoA:oxalate CoA-transferase
LLVAFRLGVIERLGSGYDAMAALISGLIYLSISGIGHVGPLSGRLTTDSVLQAFSGLMQVNKGSVDGLPHRIKT